MYIKIDALQNDVIDNFVADNNIFAVFDSPANILFADNFITNIEKMKDVFRQNSLPENIFFSCKCNKSFAFLKIASEQNCGIEVSSKYELRDALKFTNRIIASGPGKDEDYLRESIEQDAIISVDDIHELCEIVKISKQSKIMLRCSSNWIGIPSRFGIQLKELDDCLKLIENKNINLLGFSFHINNYNLEDRVEMIKKILSVIKEKNLKIKYIDVGGGIPVNYCKEDDFKKFISSNNEMMYFANKKLTSFYPYYNNLAECEFLNQFLSEIKNQLNGIEICVEPGRVLVNNCGISVYKVEYVKETVDGNIIVTNSNINNLSEQWFNTDYLIEPKLFSNNKTEQRDYFASVAGNLCLENDMVTWRKIKFQQKPQPGDLLIYYNTAGYQMDSNESMFHKIPLVKKYVVQKKDNNYIIIGDEKYDNR